MDLYMVELAATDWRAAAAWYKEVFGLKPLYWAEEDGFVLFQAGPVRLALKQARAVCQEDTATGTGTLLVFTVSSLDAELARLAGLGVIPELPPQTSPEGYRRAIFRDPEGHRLCLFEWTHETRSLP
jgi:predicted enzyme related to lactoylglutathione lyase